MDLDSSINALKEALLGDQRVSAAILFGSAAKGFARATSDLDVAVVAASAQAVAELDADALALSGRLSAASGRDTQVVLLERVEPALGRQAFLGGRVLFDRDPARTADVLERVLIEYFDGEYHRRLRAEALDFRQRTRRG
ncbi:MAG: type VII toxin-antitoxin system MntA family adenylyltransferase antitoxin [Betaproteobacteria bacterium]